MRVGDEFEYETGGRHGEQSAEREKDVAPAEQIAQHAAGGLAEQLAENVAGGVAGKDRLQAGGGYHVAEIGQRDRDHPAGNRAGRQPCKRKLLQRQREAAGCHQQSGDGAGGRDGDVFAETVAYRPGNELHGSVGDGVQRDDDRGDADGGVKVEGDLRQQRVGHAHLRLGGKAGRREQSDGTDRGFALGLRRRRWRMTRWN